METTFFTKPLSLNFTINFVYMLNIIKGCQWQTSTSKSSNGPAMTEQQKSTKQATNAGSIAGEAGLWPSLRHTRGGRGGPPTYGLRRIIQIFFLIKPFYTSFARNRHIFHILKRLMYIVRFADVYFHRYSVIYTRAFFRGVAS